MSKKESIKLTTNKYKEITAGPKNEIIEESQMIPEVEAVPSDPALNETLKKESLLERVRSFFEKKVYGAIKELFRHKELDLEVENSLGEGLDNYPEFIEESKAIDEERDVLILEACKAMEDMESEIETENVEIASVEIEPETKSKNIETTPYVFDETAQRAIKELEKELTDPFKKYIYNRLADKNKQLLLDHLVDNPVSSDSSEIIKLSTLSEANDNVIAFSDNGYLIKLVNKSDAASKDSLEFGSEQTAYQIISPSGKTVVTIVNLLSAFKFAKKRADEYQQILKNEFFQQKTEDEAVIENEAEIETEPEPEIKVEVENKIEAETGHEEVGDVEEKIKKLAEQMEQQDADIAESKKEEDLSFEKFIKELDKTDEPVKPEESSVSTSGEEEKKSSEDISATLESFEKKEYESSPLFNKFVLSKLSGWSKDRLESSLSEKEINRQKVEVWNREYILDIVSFSSVGYSIYLENQSEVRDEKGLDIKSKKAIYTLVNNEGASAKQNLNYNEAMSLLRSESEIYLEKLNEEFETNKEEIEKELTANEEEAKNNESTPVKNEEETENNELKSEEFVNAETSASLNSNVSNYAESIGINQEELTTNQEFLSLSPEQQQFALETLRRASLAKSRVEGHKAFIAEMSSKNLFQKIPYLINKKYHKERHKIEAAKNIESHGLEGYGETELSWLVNVIKNGPEVKMNESGEVIVNCLRGECFSDEQKELIADYNEGARRYIEEPGKDDGRKAWLHDLKKRIFSTVTNDNDQGKLIHAFFEAEKNMQLLKFLSANKETEKALDKIASRSLTGSDRNKALWDAHKDKAGYAALGFTLRTGSKFALANTAALAGTVSFIAAPVAALVGAYRSGNMAIETLKENKELADLGIQDKSETAKALNIVSGTKIDSKGNEIFFGLKDKLDNLTNKLEELRMAGEFKKAQEFEEALRVRIVYTEGKMVNDGIDFGQGVDRGMNYLDLADSLVRANMAILSSEDNSEFKNKRYYNNVSETTKKLTRKRNLSEENLTRLQELSVEDRLRSFLNYKHERQIKKEETFLIKEMAKGAVLGASFAIVGSVIAEHLGIGDWLNKHNPLKAAGKGIEALKNVFSKDDAVSVAPSGTNTVETVTNITASGGATEDVVAVETAAPKVEKFVDTISNEGLNGKTDSVWRSVKEIFKANSEELGYKGDPSNQQALDAWSETQTAKAVSHSGNLTDKVFSGNKVKLINDGDHFRIAVEQGSGSKPAFLPEKIGQPEGLENDIEPMINKESVGDLAQKVNHDFYIDDNKLQRPVSPDAQEFIEKTAKELNLKNLSQQDNNLIYQGAGKSQVILDSASHRIKEVVDASGNRIPDSFFNEVVDKSKPDKFIRKGGLDKIFTNWNKLSSEDKFVYKNLDWFGKKTLNSEELLKRMSEAFEINMDGIKIDNNHFVFSDGRKFDMTLKGVKNLVKFLSRN